MDDALKPVSSASGEFIGCYPGFQCCYRVSQPDIGIITQHPFPAYIQVTVCQDFSISAAIVIDRLGTVIF